MEPRQALDAYMESVALRYKVLYDRDLAWLTYADFVYEVRAALKATNLLDSRTLN